MCSEEGGLEEVASDLVERVLAKALREERQRVEREGEGGGRGDGGGEKVSVRE